jgi:hypothetical protein
MRVRLGRVDSTRRTREDAGHAVPLLILGGAVGGIHAFAVALCAEARGR